MEPVTFTVILVIVSATVSTLSRLRLGVQICTYLAVAVLLAWVGYTSDHLSSWVLACGFAVVFVAAERAQDHRWWWFGLLVVVWVALMWSTEKATFLVFPLFLLAIAMARTWAAAVILTVLIAAALLSLALQEALSVTRILGLLAGAVIVWVLGAVLTVLSYTVKERDVARADAERASKRNGELAEHIRIAGEVQDSTAQGLSSVLMLLHAAEARTTDERALEYLRLARHSTADNLEEARRRLSALESASSDDADLPAALQRVASTTSWGDRVHVAVDGSPHQLPKAVEEALIRVAQSLLGNAVRHSKADEVHITLTYQADEVLLDVVDNGVGFDVQRVQNEGSVGLPTARRRIEELGGKLSIDSRMGEGTEVSVSIPMSRISSVGTL